MFLLFENVFECCKNTVLETLNQSKAFIKNKYIKFSHYYIQKENII